WLTRLLRRCGTAGWVSFRGGERPGGSPTEGGREGRDGHTPRRRLPPPPPPPRPARRTAVATEELDADGHALFEALRAWRLGVAREAGMAPFMVASDRTLRDIARLGPGTPREPAVASGLGRHQ